MQIIKRENNQVRAWQLGAGSEMEQAMLAQGLMIRHKDGSYELFSQEAVDGRGEQAQAGDYFKVDNSGRPYPNERTWFEAKHQHLAGDIYTQLPEQLTAWSVDEPTGEELRFLLDQGLLALHPETPDHYFSAILFGAPLSAARDAVLVFYSVERAPNGQLCRVDFNFVAREAFEQTYTIINFEPPAPSELRQHRTEQ